MREILQYRGIVLLGTFVAVFFGCLAFMANDNLPPYEYDAEKSFIVPSPAVGGDQITVMWKLKRVNRLCAGSNRRTLFDPQTRVLLATYDPTIAAMSDSLKDGYLNLTFALPKSLPPGRIGYRATLSYQCNLFQRYIRPLVVTTPELFFTIKDAGK